MGLKKYMKFGGGIDDKLDWENRDGLDWNLSYACMEFSIKTIIKLNIGEHFLNLEVTKTS